MFKRTLPILLILSVFLTACGPEASHTMSPADVQGTAVAAASTMVAATQQTIPAATSLPPTEPPSPTSPPTFTPAPTLSLSIPPTTTTAVIAADTDNCLHPLNIAEARPKKRVRIENESGGTSLSLSLSLYEPNAVGQCGALLWAGKPKNWTETIEIPAGSWFAYAWITHEQGNTESSGSFVLGNSKSDDLLRLIIKKDAISLVGS